MLPFYLNNYNLYVSYKYLTILFISSLSNYIYLFVLGRSYIAYYVKLISSNPFTYDNI